MLTRLTPPTAPVLLAEVKDALRIYHNRSNAYLQTCLDAAFQYLDGPNGVIGQLLASQKWKMQTAWFTDPMRLPIGPVATVDSIEYIDTSGVTQTLSPSVYYLFSDARGPYIALAPNQSWPSTMGRDDAVSITFTGGLNPFPAPLKSAIFLLVSHMNEFREVQVVEQTFPTGFGLSDLIAPYRRVF